MLLTCLAGLSACAPGSGAAPLPTAAESAPGSSARGQTLAQLQATLATIPGLSFEEAAGSAPNAKGNTGFGFDLTLGPDSRIVDAERLVTFLVESA